MLDGEQGLLLGCGGSPQRSHQQNPNPLTFDVISGAEGVAGAEVKHKL